MKKTFRCWMILCVCTCLSAQTNPSPTKHRGRDLAADRLPGIQDLVRRPRSQAIGASTAISTCNNNGICEPWLGDSCTTCADCVGNAQCAQLAQVCNWYNFVGGKPGPVYDQCLNGTYIYLYWGLRYLAEKYAAPGSNIVNEPGTPFTPGDGKCNQTLDASIEGGSCGGFPRESCANDPQDCGPCPSIENITDPNIGLGSCDPTQCSRNVCTLGQCGTASACQFNCDSAHYGGTGGANTTQSDAVDFAVDATTCSPIATLGNSICPPGGANFVSYSLETPGTLHVSINTLTGSFPSVPDSTGATPIACPSPNGGPPSFRAWLAASTINNTFLSVGGGICNTCSGFGGNEVPTVEAYDTTSGAWYSKASLQAARFGEAASTANGKVYTFGGTSGNQSFPVATVEEYDPGADLWSVKTNMPTPRWKLTSSTVNGTIYTIGGGASGNQCAPAGTVEAYDPVANTWATEHVMPTARWGAASDVLNGQVYVVGGSQECPQISMVVSAALEVYDPSTDSWATKAPMSTPRWDLAAAATNGKLYAIGGWDPANHKALDTVEEFDPTTNSWATKSPMPTAQSGLVAVAINGKIYAFGGINQFNQILSLLEIYDPSTDKWTTASPAPSTAPPSITLVSPNSGTQGQIISNFSVTGTNFDASNSQLSFSPPDGITASIQTRTTTQIVASIAITSSAPVRARDVIVTNPDSQQGKLSGAFTVLAAPPPTGTINVSTNLPAATFTIAGPASFSGSGTSATFNNALIGGYTITFGSVVGYITPSQQTQTLTAGGIVTFSGTYNPLSLPPTISSISPLSGNQGQTLTVTVNGANFQTGATLGFSGNGIIAPPLSGSCLLDTDTNCVSPTLIRAEIMISPLAPIELKDVSVNNPEFSKSSLPHTFRVDLERLVYSGGVNEAADEPSLAVDPIHPDHLVVGFNVLTKDKKGNWNFTNGKCGWAESFDDGRTWSAGSLQFPPPFQAAGDPWVRFSPNGQLFYSCMGNTGSGSGSAIAVFMWRSQSGSSGNFAPSGLATNLNTNLPRIVRVIRCTTEPCTVTDEPTFDILQSGLTPRLVACWLESQTFKNHTEANFSNVMTAFSDGGLTWSQPQTLFPATAAEAGQKGFACRVGVGPTATVGTPNSIGTSWLSSFDDNLYIRKSSDGAVFGSKGLLAPKFEPLLQSGSTTAAIFSRAYASLVPGQDSILAVAQERFFSDLSATFVRTTDPTAVVQRKFIGDTAVERFLPSAGDCGRVAGTYQVTQPAAVSGKLFRYTAWSLDNWSDEPLGPVFVTSSDSASSFAFSDSNFIYPRIGEYTAVACSGNLAWAKKQPASWRAL